MLLVTVLCSLIYGVIVGSFSGGDQWWAAPVKIAGGLLICTVICLPSLYIFGCLSGAQVRVREMFGMVLGLLMLMTILLIGSPCLVVLKSIYTRLDGRVALLFSRRPASLRFLDAAFRTRRRGHPWGCARG
jgi:hypothetical protein